MSAGPCQVIDFTGPWPGARIEEGNARRGTPTETLYDLPSGTDLNGNEYTWNDRVRSLVVVSGTWRCYSHGRANTVLDDTPIEEFDPAQKTPEPGWSCLVSGASTGPVEFAESSIAPWHDDISSIRLVSEKNLPDWAAKDY